MSRQYAKDQPAGFKNHLERIAVVGAGGQIGQWITGELIKNKSFAISAITREDSTNAIPFDIPIIKANYDDHASLVAALKGQDCLLLTLGVMAPEDTSVKLFRAAAEAGVPWIVPNEYGSDHRHDPVGRDNMIGAKKAKERKAIEDLGVSSWVGIACLFWYEFSLGGGASRYGFDFNSKSLTWFDGGDVKLSTSTFPQVARGTAAVLGLKILPEDEKDESPCLDDYRNRFACISSFCVSQRDMFESVLRVTGDKAEDWNQSTVKIQDWYADGQQQLRSGDLNGMVKMLYSRVFFPNAPGDMSGRLDNNKLSLPQESLDEFTEKAIDLATTGYFDDLHQKMMAGRESSRQAGQEGGYEKLMNDHNMKS